jgi:hypothetical protein
VSPATAEAEPVSGYALPPGTYAAPELRRTRFGWLLGRWGIAIVAVAAALIGLTLLSTKKAPHFMCPPDWVGRRPACRWRRYRFTAPDGSFSVAYPAPNAAYEVSRNGNHVMAKFTAGDTGVIDLFSEPAAGRTRSRSPRT